MVVQEVPLEKVVIPAEQLRRRIDKEKLKELAASMQSIGLINPITVRKAGDKYILLAGLRRTLAAKLLGWTRIKAEVLDIDEFKAIAVTLHENLEREEITPLEYAEFLKKAREKYKLKLSELAEITGLSVPYLSTLMAITELPQEIKDLIAAKELDIRVAYELRKLKEPRLMVDVGRAIAKVRMSRDLALSYINRKAQELEQAVAKNTIETHREVKKQVEEQIKELPESEQRIIEEVYVQCDLCGEKYPISGTRMIRVCKADYSRLETLQRIAKQLGTSFGELLDEIIRRITEV